MAMCSVPAYTWRLRRAAFSFFQRPRPPATVRLANDLGALILASRLKSFTFVPDALLQFRSKQAVDFGATQLFHPFLTILAYQVHGRIPLLSRKLAH